VWQSQLRVVQHRLDVIVGIDDLYSALDGRREAETS
jgi:hypothetical protein